MTHVNTVKTNSTTYTYDQLQQMMANGTLDTSSIKDVSVFNASSDSSQCTDGKDDGKIGFFSALGSTIKGAVKGVVNGVKGMFTDDEGNFSLGKTLKTALTVGACFIPGVGPVIAGGLCAYGAVKGGVGIAKGVAAAATATTDAEKKAAFESIGANGVATAASAVGLKASVGAISAGAKAATGTSAFESASGITGKAAGLAKDAAAGITNYYGTAWNAATGTTAAKVGQVAKAAAKDTAGNIVNAARTAKDAVKEKTSKITNKKGNTATEGTSSPEVKTEYTKGADGKITQTKTETINIEEMTQEAINSLNSSYKIDWDTMTATKTTTVTGAKAQAGNTANNIKNSANEFANNAITNGYKGLSTTGGNVTTAALATTANAISNSASDIENQIPYASTSYATVNTQTGYEYDLEDYTILSADEVNQKYANIMNQTYAI